MILRNCLVSILEGLVGIDTYICRVISRLQYIAKKMSRDAGRTTGFLICHMAHCNHRFVSCTTPQDRQMKDNSATGAYFVGHLWKADVGV